MFGKCLVLQESKLSTQKYVNKDYVFLPNCEFFNFGHLGCQNSLPTQECQATYYYLLTYLL